MIAKPLCTLLEKDVKFNFNYTCITAFNALKKMLVEAQIIITPDEGCLFELMYDASDFAIGAFL